MHRKLLTVCAGLSGAALLAVAIVDNARPWRHLQAEYLAAERAHLDARLAGLRQQQRESLAQLAAATRAEESRLEERRDEIAQLETELRAFLVKAQNAELRWERSRAEARAADPSEPAAGSDPASQEQRLARMEVEGFRELIEDRERQLAAIRSDLTAARQSWTAARQPIEALERERRALGRDLGPWLGLWFAPIAVREVTVLDHPERGGAPRIDRCATCHLDAALGRSEGLPLPPHARPHPRPELFLAADSPHPYSRFGCTVCHGGAGRATDFSRAGHAPRDPDQAARWRTHRGWRPADLPGRPMLPLDLTEAACARCHPTAVVTETLVQGRDGISALGCTGCHASRHPALAGLPKAGPSLASLPGKTRREWAYAWLAEPQPGVPHDVAVPASGDGEARQRRETELTAIVDYLWDASHPAAYEAPDGGDAEAGRALFAGVGCAGCHTAAPEDGAETERHGPNLSRVGSKVQASWLAAFLLDPHAVRPGTPMPSLRLTADEAADLVAYLMTRRDPGWEDVRLPPLAAGVRDALIRSHLEQDLGIEASQARLEAMSDRERSRYLGERTIADHGCDACHEIPGFETAPPPEAASLEEIAARLRRRPGPDLAPGRRHRWLPEDHVPAYGVSDAQARAVTVAVLGLGAAPGPGGRPDAREAALIAGRRLVERYGCRGCHVIEGRGGAIAATLEPAQAPPDLSHAGARLDATWLFDYLAHPERTTSRSWLTTRMPSFALSGAELNALVRYFLALEERETFALDRSLETSSQLSREVGRVVFEMLQCDSCHGDTETGTGTAGSGFALPPEEQPAPSYRQARQRLRPDWVVDWILDPTRWRPRTPMPATFQADGGAELDSSFLVGSIQTPIFSPERDRLRRLFESDEALHAYLAAPEKVAAALRDHLWTLSE